MRLLAIVAAVLLVAHAHAQHMLTLSCQYPDHNLPSADAVIYLRGDGLGLNWSSGVPMHRNASNLWSISLPLSAQSLGKVLQFKLLVQDSTWQIGSNNMVLLPAQQGSVTYTAYPYFYTSQGRYFVLDQPLYSPQLKNSRAVVVYTPPSYLENPYKKLPLLIMHDGQNLFNASTSAFGTAWMCQNTLDAEIAQGNMEEILIAGLYNTADRINEYTYSYDSSVPGGGKGDLYLDFLQHQVIPYMRSHFRIVDESEGAVGILGSSLGGLISCYAAWTRPTVFGVAGCMSSSFWWNNEDFLNSVMVKHPIPHKVDIYLDSGNAGASDDDVTQTIAVRNQMETDGFELGQDLHYYLDNGGQHNEYFWGKRFWSPMLALYPPVAQPVH